MSGMDLVIAAKDSKRGLSNEAAFFDKDLDKMLELCLKSLDLGVMRHVGLGGVCWEDCPLICGCGQGIRGKGFRDRNPIYAAGHEIARAEGIR